MAKAHIHTKLFSNFFTKIKYFEKHLKVVANELGAFKIDRGEF